MYNDDIHPDHQAAVDRVTDMIALDDVCAYPIDGGGIGIEIDHGYFDEENNRDAIDHYEYRSIEDAIAVAEDVKSKLDYYEEQGLGRDQLLWLADFLTTPGVKR